MAIFKKTVFGLNVVGPQGINAINDFVVGETEDGETGVLVAHSLLTDSGLKYIDEQGKIHDIPMLPTTPTNKTKYYKLVFHNEDLTWVETANLDLPALPVDAASKTYYLQSVNGTLGWGTVSSGSSMSNGTYVQHDYYDEWHYHYMDLEKNKLYLYTDDTQYDEPEMGGVYIVDDYIKLPEPDEGVHIILNYTSTAQQDIEGTINYKRLIFGSYNASAPFDTPVKTFAFSSSLTNYNIDIWCNNGEWVFTETNNKPSTPPVVNVFYPYHYKFAANVSSAYGTQVYLNGAYSYLITVSSVYSTESVVLSTPASSTYYAGQIMFFVQTSEGDFGVQPYLESGGEYEYDVVIQRLGYNEYITCFLEGTKVLVKDKTTEPYRVYEKNIEDIQAGDYMAFWSPAEGRLISTRAVVPAIKGTCNEYDVLSFSDGTTVNVFGNQFFWDVDKDRLIDWKNMVVNQSRVCKPDGTIVTYVGAEHIESETELNHYTIMTYKGRYIAGGIQVGDKVDLCYPRLHSEDLIEYWDALPEEDKRYFIKKWDEGSARRHWRGSKAYYEALRAELTEQHSLERDIIAKKAFLDESDNDALHYAEGILTEEEYAPIKASRIAAITAIRADKERIAELKAIIAEKEPAIKAQIHSTFVAKYAGMFVGKDKAIVEK